MSDPADLILAIDQGTSATKVVVFDDRGRLVASAGAETLVSYPEPTWMESDAEGWWRAVRAAIRTVLGESGVASHRVRAVGLCGLMHTLVPVDAGGHALCAPMLWPDQRATREVESLVERRDEIAEVTGSRLSTMHALPRLIWLREHAPTVLAATRAFLLAKDFLRLRLTGDFATDPTDARGTGLVDQARGDWSAEFLDLAGISPSQMPPIRRSDEVVGVVAPSAAAETGLHAGTPVVCGAGDWFCTLVGSGCHLPERISLYLGTAGILGAFASAAEYDRLGATRYYGSVTSTGSALRWIRDLLCAESAGSPQSSGFGDYERLLAEAAVAPPGARGLAFLPHLMGERGFAMRPHARGTLHGLTLAHRRPDLIRAVLEGTAIWLRSTADHYLTPETSADLLALGGGARSRLWCEIVAAVFGRRLLVPRVVEGGALGAALLAAVGSGLARSYLALAREWIQIEHEIEPDTALVDLYAARRQDFERLELQLADTGVASA